MATRINSLLIDTYERALSELNIMESIKMIIPNTVINSAKIINRGNDSINMHVVRTQKKLFKSYLS